MPLHEKLFQNRVNSVSTGLFQEKRKEEETCTLLTPGLDNTRLFMSLTAGAGT
jgi:hypothetical protein